MNTLATEIRKSVDTLLAEIVAANHKIFAQANAERVEMLDLLGRMRDTRNSIDAVGAVYAEIADEFGAMADTCEEFVAKIDDTLEDPAAYCPSLPYEDFRGFCEMCGAEIADTEDAYDIDEDGLLECADCINAQETDNDDND